MQRDCEFAPAFDIYENRAMTLHDVMMIVLRENGAPMTAQDIAAEISRRELYLQRKGTPAPPRQIRTRARKCPHLFTQSSGLIGLLEWSGASPKAAGQRKTGKQLVPKPAGPSFVGPDDDVTKIGFLRAKGFVFIGSIGQLFGYGLPKLKELEFCGIYAITIAEDYQARFISPDVASERGNVIRPWSLEELREKWVKSVDIVYYGLAGCRSFSPLKKRLRSLIRHGSGHTTDRGPHKGGEILWQLVGYEGFGVWIYPTDPPPAPRDSERELLKSFYCQSGKLPFANRQF